MVWAWERLLVLGIAQLALCAPSYDDRSSIVPLLPRETILQSENNEVKRSSLPENTANSYNRIAMMNGNQGAERSPTFYHVQDDLNAKDSLALQQRFRPRDSSIVSEESFFDDNWSRPAEEDRLFSFDRLQDDDNSGENVSDEDDSAYVTSLKSLSAQQVDKDMHQEPIWLRKRRLQMKGPGLFGGALSRNSLGQKSLKGYRGSKNKGLVLSIDLGIKALRDAILHAKVAQKNRKYKAQAQKNMRLLHNIGKRRADSPQIALIRP